MMPRCNGLNDLNALDSLYALGNAQPITNRTEDLVHAQCTSRTGLAPVAGLAACDQSGSSAPVAGVVAGKASEQTRAANADVAARYALDIEAELKNVRRGLIAAPSGQVRDSEGNLVWDFEGFSFLQGQAPDTVNPSLWRQAVLNNQAGLFKVTEGIWQLRGFDLANLTLVQGKSGWIVIDPLTARETAEYAIAFARKHLGNQPVSAVIFTHSHVDHFGGALGVLSAEEARERQVPVIAPSGFMEEATSENLMMGVAMARRATYMYGKLLPRSPRRRRGHRTGQSRGLWPHGRAAADPIDQPA